MMRHTQSVFGDGADGSTPGNCLQTAVASLLDLPVEEVPHFVAVPEDRWWSEFLNWLTGRGLRLTMFEDRFETTSTYLDGWLISAPLSDAPKDRLVIASGMADRGLRHCVLWEDGALVHDPHPSRAGLAEAPDEIWLIELQAVFA
ncbi:MAG: hypothetical protein JWP32_2878 [Schumannella sp.]|nr:hypothetical protein [Schumannella sp.]